MLLLCSIKAKKLAMFSELVSARLWASDILGVLMLKLCGSQKHKFEKNVQHNHSIKRNNHVGYNKHEVVISCLH